jgi:TatD DNase family protein
MQLVDTHCHIHEADYLLDFDVVQTAARERGVTRLLCVGTDVESSERAVERADGEKVFSIIGIHPHEANVYFDEVSGAMKDFDVRNWLFATAKKPHVVGLGETGFDFYYNHGAKAAQVALFRLHLDVATELSLPLSFHVREGFEDFFRVLDEYSPKSQIRGVVHSFTGTAEELQGCLARGFYVAVNGISTFTKNAEQQMMYGAIPIEKLLLETDAPFLTPAPLRGNINEPKNVRVIAEFNARQIGIPLEQLAEYTTANAIALFNL